MKRTALEVGRNGPAQAYWGSICFRSFPFPSWIHGAGGGP